MNSSLRSGITLLVLTALLAVMAVWGFRELTAPLPQVAQPKEECQNVRVTKRIKRSQLQASVYNASKRKGLASDTLEDLEGLGIEPGEVGNAPSGVKTRGVVILARSEDDPSALLMAKMFRPEADVMVNDDSLGPGVDVVVGSKYRGVRANAPKSMELAEPVESCLD